MGSISRVLIANRGEIAVRIARSLNNMGISAIGVFHEEDRDAPLLQEVDDAVEIFGENPLAAYMDAQSLLSVCRQKNVDAIHPGYGFLAESGDFSQAVAEAGFIFIGPTPSVIRLMGHKQNARDFVLGLGLPVAPSVYRHDDAFVEKIMELGFPLVIKAVAGGGGKGMRVVRSLDELEPGLKAAQSEGLRYFGDGQVYCERYIERPRHIEVQVLADRQGNCIHLGERDCSVQRRFQKIIEESPAPGLATGLRNTICDSAVAIAKAANYTGAGTVEFLLAPDGEYYFLEMNTRLQVEHPVTEMVIGLDLVEEQVRIASGESLRLNQEQVQLSGHAIECRICAEVADEGHLPATGQIDLLIAPEGPGVRFDSGIQRGQKINSSFDSLLAKLIVHGSDREQALGRMRQALQNLVLLGVQENSAYLQKVIGHPAFQAGQVHTHLLEDLVEDLSADAWPKDELVNLVALASLADKEVREVADRVPQPYAAMGSWRN